MVRSEHWLVSGAAPSYVNGLEFIKFILPIFSSLQFFVASVSPAFPTVTFRVFLATLTCDSNTPLKWDPSRGFQFHLIPLLGVLSSIYTWSLCFKKFSELSLRSYKVCLIIACDFVRSSSSSLVATRRLDAARKSVVLNELANSKCTVLVAEHAKRHRYF